MPATPSCGRPTARCRRPSSRCASPSGAGLGGLVASTRKPYWTADYWSDERFRHTSAIDGAVGEEGIVAICGTPLIVESHFVGVLFAANRSSRPFTREEVALLGNLATLAAVTLVQTRALSDAETALAALSEAHETVRQYAAGIEKASAAHDRFASLVLDGGGVDDITHAARGAARWVGRAGRRVGRAAQRLRPRTRVDRADRADRDRQGSARCPQRPPWPRLRTARGARRPLCRRHHRCPGAARHDLRRWGRRSGRLRPAHARAGRRRHGPRHALRAAGRRRPAVRAQPSRQRPGGSPGIGGGAHAARRDGGLRHATTLLPAGDSRR